MTTLYRNAIVFTGDEFLENHAVLVQNGIIEAILPEKKAPTSADQVHDLMGCILTAGMIDLQVYGGGGALFSSHPTLATLENLYAHLRANSTIGFLATLPTALPELMHMAIGAAKAFRDKYPEVLFGLHFEGPFLNPAKRGAHPAEHMVVPEKEAVEYWLKAGQGLLRMMTIAPEWCTPEVLALGKQYGVVFSAGHSNATYEAAMAGFGSGCGAVTHFFNAMSQWQGREPGLVGAAFDHPTVPVSIIADGVHVSWPSVRMAKRILGKRLFLITDAVDGSGDGDYRFFLNKDHYVNAAGTLGGSALTMPLAVRNCVGHQVCDLDEAIRMATRYPAEVIGVHDRYGSIAPGFCAEFGVIER
jgi:N-acetylglucosamine-6-phosphate deacetylase